MAKSARPYRRSIWQSDPQYDLDHLSLTKTESKTIFRLSSVDAAKKNAPPIARKNLLDISKAAKAMPPVGDAKAEDIEQYLRRGLAHLGTGIPTLICMLAVESEGKYPPMDRKFAAGMRARNKVFAQDLKCLMGENVAKFAEVYAARVIPAWRESTKDRSPEEADNYWGRGGRDDS